MMSKLRLVQRLFKRVWTQTASDAMGTIRCSQYITRHFTEAGVAMLFDPAPKDRVRSDPLRPGIIDLPKKNESQP